ncbi:MAG TPA: hypothetical protein VNB64_08800 [Solirubrobacteraceae bacterium]|nr:hypothetical protein [Solirubrobacteraceae bacterium]
MKPGKQGEVSVFRRPAGNRIEPKLCGTMPSKALALALMRQLEQAESVVNDLFLEATDDGIEALEAILRACRESVERRAARHQHPPREPRQKRGPATPKAAAGRPPAGDGAADPAPTTDGPKSGGPRRRRSRPNRRGRPDRG